MYGYVSALSEYSARGVVNSLHTQPDDAHNPQFWFHRLTARDLHLGVHGQGGKWRSDDGTRLSLSRQQPLNVCCVCRAVPDRKSISATLPGRQLRWNSSLPPAQSWASRIQYRHAGSLAARFVFTNDHYNTFRLAKNEKYVYVKEMSQTMLNLSTQIKTLCRRNVNKFTSIWMQYNLSLHLHSPPGPPREGKQGNSCLTSSQP